MDGHSGGTLAALTAVLVVAFDQATKALVRSQIPRGDDRDLVAGARLVHVRNDGVAFGQFGGSALLVGLVVALALAGLLVYFASHRDTPLIWLPTGLLLGGAVGNLVDRALAGAVTDWIKLPRWPAFNVADIAITAGVVSLLLVVEVDARRRERSASQAPERER